MAYTGTTAGGGYGDLGGLRAEGREPGARRKKLAGYLKAANELRQSYFNQEGGVSTRDFGGADLSGVEGPGAFPEAATVRSGNEEMILFPSYARRHVKGRPKSPPQSAEMSEQEYWQREWDRHQDDNAIVDVEVRGWIYTPHKGQANRKQRLMIGLARQLSGLPAPPQQRDYAHSSQFSSAEASPQRPSKQDEELIAHEAENIVRRGEQEQQYARRGAFSEEPKFDKDGDSIYEFNSRGTSRNVSPERGRHFDSSNKRASQMSANSSGDGDADSIAPLSKRPTWRQPEKMTAAELTTANGHLLNRLRLFMANGLQNAPISCFFYNESCARQHTVETGPSGHFTCRAPLDFVPTHVRVLASEKLAATEEVQITSPKGVSMISDIDDTIKHSAISSGAREIFRNAFIRELGDLTIDGVREWYNTMHDMGVQLHYVSNSPWQLYPVLASYFKLAQLPKGSFHLKQYSGYLQGIFEPVAERKKSSLEKIMGDFPDRKFILIGDSGEADLEVYTDVALENPGRVLGIFIRDVTTSVKTGYFDPSNSRPGSAKSSRNHSRNQSRNHSRGPSGDTLAMSKRLSRPDDIRQDDRDLKAAIAASLADMEEETQRAKRRINPDAPAWGEYTEGESPKSKPSLPPRRGTDKTITASPTEDLIDLSEDVPHPKQPWLTPPPSNSAVRTLQQNGSTQAKPSPSPPPKPQALRSPSPTPSPEENPERRDSASKPPPPRPRKPSSAVKPPSPAQIQTWTSTPPMPQPQTPAQHQPSPLSQVTQNSPETGKERPPLPARPKTYAVLSKGLASAYNALPTSHWRGGEATATTQPRAFPPPHSNGTPSESSSLRNVSTLSSAKSTDDLRGSASAKKPAPPPPPARRRPMTAHNTTSTARTSVNRLSGSSGWDDYDLSYGGSGGGYGGASGGGGSGGNLPGSPGEAGMSRKEFLWQQRWARAKSVLDKQGVTLRSWRVGIDVADVCVKLVEQAQREIKREEEKARYQRQQGRS